MQEITRYMDMIDADDAKRLVCEFAKEIKQKDKHLYNDIWYKLHCMAYGEHFDKELAEYAVGKMENADGTHGAHWTLEQTNQLAEQADIKQLYDWYYVLNMMFSDYGKIFGNESTIYAKLAKAYINDVDAPKGKVFNTWLLMKEQ